MSAVVIGLGLSGKRTLGGSLEPDKEFLPESMVRKLLGSW